MALEVGASKWFQRLDVNMSTVSEEWDVNIVCWVCVRGVMWTLYVGYVSEVWCEHCMLGMCQRWDVNNVCWVWCQRWDVNTVCRIWCQRWEVNTVCLIWRQRWDNIPYPSHKTPKTIVGQVEFIIIKSTHHIAEQSKLTRSHLWGLKLKESANWKCNKVTYINMSNNSTSCCVNCCNCYELMKMLAIIIGYYGYH